MSRNIVIDWDAINKKIFSSPSFQNKAIPLIKRKFSKEFNAQKRKLLEEFEDSSITQEIEEGPEANDVSGLLDGRGNLFSYIGFEEGSRPITRLRNLLNKIEPLEPRLNINKQVWEFRVPIPDKDDIAKVSTVEWMSGSWVDELEKGMSNLGHYYYNRNGITFGDSRSRTGIQMDGDIYAGSKVVRARYLSQMLANFRRSLRD